MQTVGPTGGLSSTVDGGRDAEGCAGAGWGAEGEEGRVGDVGRFLGAAVFGLVRLRTGALTPLRVVLGAVAVVVGLLVLAFAVLLALLRGPESRGSGVIGDDTIGVVMTGRSWMTVLFGGRVSTTATTAATNSSAAKNRIGHALLIASAA